MDFFEQITDIEANINENAKNQGLYNSIVLGTIVENWDKEHKGMVKVEFDDIKKEYSRSHWLEVLVPYKGFYFQPEIGTRVVVGLINNSFANGIILGALSGVRQYPPDKMPEEKNIYKCIRTSGGNEIYFDDTDKKQKLIIKTPLGLNATLDDEKKQVSIQDKDSKNKIILDIENGKIVIQADKEISIKAGGTEVIQSNGKDLNFKATNIKITADGKLEEKGSQMVLKGSTVDIKADGQLNVNSSGIANIKGSMLKLN